MVPVVFFAPEVEPTDVSELESLEVTDNMDGRRAGASPIGRIAD